jgi:hypothetical protein
MHVQKYNLYKKSNKKQSINPFNPLTYTILKSNSLKVSNIVVLSYSLRHITVTIVENNISVIISVLVSLGQNTVNGRLVVFFQILQFY